MNKHTPTPWHYAPDLSNHGTQLIYGLDNYLVVDAGRINKRNLEETRLNAEFIVRAVNSHEELLRCLKEVHTEEIENEHFGDDLKKTPCTYCMAIAKAEGK